MPRYQLQMQWRRKHALYIRSIGSGATVVGIGHTTRLSVLGASLSLLGCSCPRWVVLVLVTWPLSSHHCCSCVAAIFPRYCCCCGGRAVREMGGCIIAAAVVGASSSLACWLYICGSYRGQHGVVGRCRQSSHPAGCTVVTMVVEARCHWGAANVAVGIIRRSISFEARLRGWAACRD